DYWSALRLVSSPTAAERVRPFVYAASGSHASYPFPCSRKCWQGGRWRSLPDGHHNGGTIWDANDDAKCRSCLAPLPTDREGDPALWNAFGGRWGASHCLLGSYICDVGIGPES